MTDRDQAASTELATYDAARRALELAVATDDVLEIRNQAIAWAAYARQAKDRELEVKAMHIRFRAIRRLGELISAQKETVGLATGAAGIGKAASAVPDEYSTQPPTLAEAGIDRKLSSQAQRMAALPRERFESLLVKHEAEARGGAPKVSADLMRVDSEDEGRANRRNLAAELSGRSAELPSGRRFPCWYVDLPWRREGGVTDRSYENHYPTMSWPEILAFLERARGLLLPDAWGFFWIPRAHLLAMVEIEIEVTVVATGEVVLAKVNMPLAWAVAKAAGFDSYSTCFVWTKNDEDHPDEAGGAILARDQDELLLLFRKGRGLPKPATSEKYGSNHRERSRLLGHSRKPEHYRTMIADMVGADLAGEPLPVMEFFARVDAEHPLPRNWSAWGNQASALPQGDVAIATGASDSSAPAPDTENQIAAGAFERRADEPALPPEMPSEAAGTVDAAPITVPDLPATAVPPAERPGSLFPAIEISELEALRAISKFADPRRRAVIEILGDDFQAKGYAIEQGGSGEWILREAGWRRLRELEAALPAADADDDPLMIPKFLRRPPTARAQQELDLARIDRAPAEIVDGALQTRIPLEPLEPVLLERLRRVAAGEQLPWHEMRDLCAERLVHVPTRGAAKITDEGEAFLAQLVAPTEGAPA